MRAIIFTVLMTLTAPAFAAEPSASIAPLELGLPNPSLAFERYVEPLWIADGRNLPGSYIVGTTKTDGMSENEVAVIAAQPGATGTGAMIKAPGMAEAWRGQRIRLSARIKTEDVERVHLWLRIRGPQPDQQRYYAMAENPIRGTTGWQRYDIVMDVPKDAIWLHYGFTLHGGRGKAYAEAVGIEVVGTDVALTPLADVRADGWQTFVFVPSATALARAAGWMPAGSRPMDYNMGPTVTEDLTRPMTFRIQAKADAERTGFGTLMRLDPAAPWRGKRVQLSARMKGENVDRLQLWLRVDGGVTPLAFYNMGDRPVQGDSAWQRYAVVLDVPQGAERLAYGFFVAGGGVGWAEDFRIEEVGRDVPVSAMPSARQQNQQQERWDRWNDWDHTWYQRP